MTVLKDISWNIFWARMKVGYRVSGVFSHEIIQPGHAPAYYRSCSDSDAADIILGSS